MGRNWITLQDGTGTKPGNKIVATSQETATIGDLVIAKGKINTDVDLGRGYHARFSQKMITLGYSHSQSKPVNADYLTQTFKGQILRCER